MTYRSPFASPKLLSGLCALGTLLHDTAAQAIAGGASAPDGTYGFAAHVQVGADRACSGVLVAPGWILTTKTCLAVAPAAGAGSQLQAAATVTVGKTQLAGPGGLTASVSKIVQHPTANAALLRLSRASRALPPVPIAEAPARGGDDLVVLGYGRTESEWVPGALQRAELPDSPLRESSPALAMTGTTGVSVCKGDAGGPVLRRTGTSVELVAIVERGWQGGCLGETEKRGDWLATRTDTLRAWIAEQTAQPARHDYDGDGLSDVAILTDDGGGRASLWAFEGIASTRPDLRVAWTSAGSRTDWSRSASAAGDFDGDGSGDVALLTPNSAGLQLSLFDEMARYSAAPRAVWSGNFGASARQVTAGDFNGDAVAEFAVLIDHGAERSELLQVESLGGTPSLVSTWDSGPGGWDSRRTKLVSGDFDGDGRDSLALLYDAGPGVMEVWLLDAMDDEAAEPRRVWSGALDWFRLKGAAADTDGDGAAEILIFTDLGSNSSSLRILSGLDSAAPSLRPGWASAPGSWGWERTRLSTGDFNADGRTDLAILYALDGARTQLWLFDALIGNAPPRLVWDSEAGNWEGSRALPATGEGQAETLPDALAALKAPSRCGTLSLGEALRAGQSLRSCNGFISLQLSDAGAMRLVGSAQTVTWQHGALPRRAFLAALEARGDFVLHELGGSVVWRANAGAVTEPVLRVQNDGNLVLYANGGRTPLLPRWSTGTYMRTGSACGRLDPNQGLQVDAQVASCNGRYRLTQQRDGNLVLYENPSRAVWSTSTPGSTGYVALMQPDGNLVVYAHDDRPLWASGTSGNPGAYAVLQDDGRLSVQAAGRSLWTSPAPPPPPPPPPRPSDCSIVQYCNAPGADGTRCIGTAGCSRADIETECRADVRTVCGSVTNPLVIRYP